MKSLPLDEVQRQKANGNHDSFGMKRDRIRWDQSIANLKRLAYRAAQPFNGGRLAIARMTGFGRRRIDRAN